MSNLLFDNHQVSKHHQNVVISVGLFELCYNLALFWEFGVDPGLCDEASRCATGSNQFKIAFGSGTRLSVETRE